MTATAPPAGQDRVTDSAARRCDEWARKIASRAGLIWTGEHFITPLAIKRQRMNAYVGRPVAVKSSKRGRRG